MKTSPYIRFIASIISYATTNEQHRSDERDYWKKQIRVSKWLNKLTGVAAAVAFAGIAVLWSQTQTLKEQAADTRAQISAFLTIPEDPPTIIKMDDSWHFILDFYLANVGQSAARETYINAVLTMIGEKDSDPFYSVAIGGGPMLIPLQPPWHHIFDLGLPMNTTVINGIPKAGEQPQTSTMMIMPVHNIGISLKGKISFATVFREEVTLPVNLAASFPDARIACCDFLQLEKGVPLIYPADLTRIPEGAIPKKKGQAGQ